MKSGYTIAGCEILSTVIDTFFFSPNFKRNFTKENIQNFLGNFNILHSFGTNFGGRKEINKFINKEKRTLEYLKYIEYYNKSKLFIDSGGYNISIGTFNKEESNILYNVYYQFLINVVDLYDRAFILDIPPGNNCQIFNSFKDVYDWNLKSYIEASQLPNNVRDKITFIFHFRTPKLWDIYKKIMDDNNLFDKFNFHATGGIVANMITDLIIPCIIYVIPLIALLNRAKKSGRKKLNFHILGGSGFRDILFYELFKIHIMETHGIELEITYDSSGIFKALMIGRFIHILKDKSVFKTNIRTSNLNMRHESSNMKIIDLYREALNGFADENGFKRINLNSIYDPKTGTFYEDVRLYNMLYVLSNYPKMEGILKQKAKEIYQLYKSNEMVKFNNEIELITRKINSDKITKKQKAKSSSIIRSLDMLTELDEDHCKYLINKFLSKDEFTELEGEGRKNYTF
jgi:hypothetical protein